MFILIVVYLVICENKKTKDTVIGSHTVIGALTLYNFRLKRLCLRNIQLDYLK